MIRAEEVKGAVDGFRRDVSRLRDEVGKVIVGHEPIVEGVVMALLAGGHALLEGVPGLGKTMLVRTLADAVDLTFSRIQFTPDLMPADIIGTNVIVEDERGKRFQFQRGPIFANVVLADEVNRATPKTQSALLEAMQERSVTVAKQTWPLEPPFFVLATQNPLEMEGTYPLPEAQLDRFFVKLKVTFPSRESLHAILERTTGEGSPRAEKVVTGARLLELRDLVRQVPAAHAVQDYCIRVVEGTHPESRDSRDPRAVGGGSSGSARRGGTGTSPPNKYVRYGASPRGAQACLLAAKIRALLDGRFAVSTDDIKAVARPTLRHRIILNFEGEAEGIDPDTIIDGILAETPE